MKFPYHNCPIHIISLKSSIWNIFSVSIFNSWLILAFFIPRLKNRCYSINYYEIMLIGHQFKMNKLSLSCLVVVACIFTEGCKVRYSAVVSMLFCIQMQHLQLPEFYLFSCILFYFFRSSFPIRATCLASQISFKIIRKYFNHHWTLSSSTFSHGLFY